MATTDIDICSHALVMIGANPITSFDDGTTGAIVASNLYETTVRDLLGRYRWRFATGQEQLSRLTDAPSARWDAAYQLPSTMLLLHTVLVADKPIDFDRFDDKVYCDAASTDVVYAEGTYRTDEQDWPPYFVTYLELSLASLFAHGVAAQVDTADWLDRKAQRHGAIARSLDAQSRTTQRIDTKGFIENRFITRSS